MELNSQPWDPRLPSALPRFRLTHRHRCLSPDPQLALRPPSRMSLKSGGRGCAQGCSSCPQALWLKPEGWGGVGREPPIKGASRLSACMRKGLPQSSPCASESLTRITQRRWRLCASRLSSSAWRSLQRWASSPFISYLLVPPLADCSHVSL